MSKSLRCGSAQESTVARWLLLVMGCHECIRACLGIFVPFFPIQLETFIRRRKVVTWSTPRTKILPAALRGRRLTQHDFSWLFEF